MAKKKKKDAANRPTNRANLSQAKDQQRNVSVGLYKDGGQHSK